MSVLTLTKRKEKLRALLERSQSNLLEIISDSNIGKCWADGSICPYGNPSGKFAEAPMGFCKECRIAENYIEELRDLFDEKIRLEEEELEQGIREDISISSISVQDLLNKLAEDAYPNKTQKELKNILKEFIKVISSELDLGLEMVVEEDEVYKKREVKNEK